MSGNKWLYLLQVSLWIFTEDIKNGVHTQGIVKESCDNEYFRARCGPGQVVVMTAANYGRLHLGRCIKTKYLNITCSANVLPHLDKLCSGLSNCSFHVIDLHSTSPCPSDLLRHLEASHICLSVHECRACKNGQDITLHEAAGTISNVIHSGVGGCSSRPCTWIIPSKSGQMFNFTLYDFSTSGNNNINFLSTGSNCQQVALIERRLAVAEGYHGGDLPKVCRDGVREKNFQIEGGGSLEITWLTSAENQGDGRFLLKYEILGCPDIKIPPGTTSERSEDGNTLTVSCINVLQTWHLTCGGLAWVGEIGVCKTGSGLPGGDNSPQSDGNSPSGLAGTLIVIGIGLGIGVVFGLCMLVLVMVYMKRRKRRPYEYPTMTSTAQRQSQGDYYPYMEKPMIVQDTDYQCTHTRPAKCPHKRPDLKSFRPIPEGDAMDDIYNEQRTGTGKSNLSNTLVMDDTTALKPRMYEKPCPEMQAKLARLKDMQQPFQ